jgi:hypothetical protein
MTRTPEQQARVERVDTVAMAMMEIMIGEQRAVQGAVLADLVALWIVGHSHRDGGDKTDKVRTAALSRFLEVVVRLIPINEQLVAEGRKKKAH